MRAICVGRSFTLGRIEGHRRTAWATWRGAVLTLFVAVAGCTPAPLQSPRPMVGGSSLRLPQNLKNKVDILFMIDNSQSMDAMQVELQKRFPEFFKVFDDLADQRQL